MSWSNFGRSVSHPTSPVFPVSKRRHPESLSGPKTTLPVSAGVCAFGTALRLVRA